MVLGLRLALGLGDNSKYGSEVSGLDTNESSCPYSNFCFKVLTNSYILWLQTTLNGSRRLKMAVDHSEPVGGCGLVVMR